MLVQSTLLKGEDMSNGCILLVIAFDGALATTTQFTRVREMYNNTLQY